MSAYPNLPDEPVIHTCPHCDFCGNEATEERIHLGDGGTITIRMLLCDSPDCLEAARVKFASLNDMEEPA